MANYTEVKRIVIIHEGRNSVYLRWLNPLGNWEGWRFAGKKKKSLVVEDKVTFRSLDGRHEKTARAEGVETMLLHTYLPGKMQIDGLKHLFTSPIVHAVIDGKEQPCTLPSDSKVLYDQAVKHGSLEVEITLNRLNSLTQ